jgi:hypothetical protein
MKCIFSLTPAFDDIVMSLIVITGCTEIIGLQTHRIFKSRNKTLRKGNGDKICCYEKALCKAACLARGGPIQLNKSEHLQ